MNVPGFTAELSLSPTVGVYSGRVSARPVGHGEVISPAQLGDFRHIALDPFSRYVREVSHEVLAGGPCSGWSYTPYPSTYPRQFVSIWCPRGFKCIHSDQFILGIDPGLRTPFCQKVQCPNATRYQCIDRVDNAFRECRSRAGNDRAAYSQCVTSQENARDECNMNCLDPPDG